MEPALGQSTPTIAAPADEGRPLASVVAELQRRFQWAVTYEDPPWEYLPDLVEITAQVRRDGKDVPKVYRPRGGPFAFRLADGSPTDPSVTLTALLEAYRQSGNDGTFALRRTGSVFHIIPTSFRDESGVARPYESLLSRRITLPAGERPILEAIGALQKTFNAQGDRQLLLATAPTNLLMQHRVEMVATNEETRVVLLRMLAASGRVLSWRLFCEPKSMTCYLNLSLVS
jgi:hypothetical protein